MNMYEFASLRGKNFRAQGNTPEEAYQKLCEMYKDDGVLWRMSDGHMVKECVKRGWSRLGENPGVAYKVINEEFTEIH